MIDAAQPPMTLRGAATVIVRRRVTVLVVLTFCVAASIGLVLSTQRLYRADALALVRSASSGAVFSGSSQSSSDARRRIANEISVLEGVDVRQRVRDDLGLWSLPPRVTGTSSTTDDLVTISVVDPDPDLAAELANAYVAAYNEVKREQTVADLARAVEELQGQISRLQGDIDAIDDQLDNSGITAQDRDLAETKRRELVSQQAVFQRTLDQRQVDANLVNSPAQLIEPASVPAGPFQPTPLRTGALGLFVGLVLGALAALLRDRLDQAIKVPGDMAKVGTTLPTLAEVPPAPDTSGGLASLRGDNDPAVETYRSLRTNMQFVAIDRDMKVVQVTSAIPGEGKTTTAANLAVVLAQADLRVLVLDADLRKPMVHEVFGVATTRGLVDVLVGRPVEEVVHRVTDHLDVIAAGRIPVNPSEMLSSRRMGEVLADLRRRYDFIVVDSAPVLPVSDAAALSRHVDGTLVVVQAGRAKVPEVRQAIERLDRVQAPLVGIVLNRVKGAARSAYGYGYGYGPGHRPGRHAGADEKPSV